MPNDGEPRRGDAALQEELRRLAVTRDPVPASVLDAARAAYAWRDIDAKLAALTHDSNLDEPNLVGVRSGAAPRLLTFEGEEAIVELEVHPMRDRRRLMGQLVPPGAAVVEVCHAEWRLRLETDGLGRFEVADVPPGPVSLRCQLRDATQEVHTEWVNL
ncbi:MAG TPA: hypothetical protein VHF25_14405 [Nitriliruptorales bacterium]|nr:hypothetical protein [Nitriliruptorales bacterium]